MCTTSTKLSALAVVLLLTMLGQSLALHHVASRDYLSLKEQETEEQDQDYCTIRHRHPEMENVVILESYIDQQLDHFNVGRENMKKFQQRYFYSDQFVVSDAFYDGPIYAFLCVGGEGPDLDWSVLVS